MPTDRTAPRTAPRHRAAGGRRAAVGALLAGLVLLAVAAVAPAAASAATAHEGHEHASSSTAHARAVAEQKRAIAALPLERAGRCTTTRRIVGAGPACRTRSGLLLVGAPGSPVRFMTHGPDLVGAIAEFDQADLRPATQARLDAASVADIVCVETPGVRRIELVYVQPADRARGSRYAEIAPQLREQLYKASAYLDAETAAMAPGVSRKLPVRCIGGVPTVANVTLEAGSPDLYDIADRLARRGFPAAHYKSRSNRRVFAYYDERISGLSGIGMIWDDQVRGRNNFNNMGGRYAIQYGATTAADEVDAQSPPNWITVLHEEMHNMGALQVDAPGHNGGKHCNDGLDLMCYGEPQYVQSRYTAVRCSLGRLDCGGDSYFNPRPARDSYLKEFWNVANPMNLWLVPTLSVPEGPDTTPPTGAGLFQSPHSTDGLIWTWDSAADRRSYTMRYVVLLQVRTDRGWKAARPAFVHADSYLTSAGAAPGRYYRVQVTPIDEAGNRGPRRISPAVLNSIEPDDVRPTVPARALLSSTHPGRLVARWSPSSDVAGPLSGYVVSLQRREAGLWREFGVRRTRSTTTVFRGQAERRAYRVVVRAIDMAGNRSGMRASNNADADGDGPFVQVVG